MEEKCNTSMSPKNKTKYIKFYNFFLNVRMNGWEIK